MIHLRVVSPPDVTGTLMPVLRSEPAVLNLTVLPGVVSHPDSPRHQASAAVAAAAGLTPAGQLQDGEMRWRLIMTP